MTPSDVILTSLLLGLFVLAGGCYAGLYGAAVLRASLGLMRAAHACCAVQVVLAVAVWSYTPLAMSWKLLIVASAVIYVFIPVLVWRYMEILHRTGAQTR